MFDGPEHTTHVSPLELLHPRGWAKRTCLLGDGCPVVLAPKGHTDVAMADLCIIAPTRAQCREPGWLARAVDVAANISADGVVYVLAPRRWRIQLARQLRARGLELRLRVGHLPIEAPERWLVPLVAAPAAHALGTLIPSRPLRRALVLWLLAIPGGAALLAALLPWAGFLFQRTDARPCFNWCASQSGRQSAIIRTSVRATHATAVLHTFTAHEQQPSAVLKLALEDAFDQRIVVEAAIMQRLRPSVERSGASMARTELRTMPDGRPVLRQTALRGQPLALLLGAQPARTNEIMVRVAGWLERWNQDTAQPHTLNRAWLEREVLVPLAQLPLLPDHAAYHHRLAAYCEQLAGRTVPLVAAHNDLTMWNVLIDRTGLQIIDWEAARLAALPLTDFVYAVVDITAAPDGYSDRLAAFHTCFTVNSTHATLVARLVGQFCRVLELEQDFAQICFHACWLHHAAHEHSECDGLEPGPFEQIVTWLAQHPDYQLELG